MKKIEEENDIVKKCYEKSVELLLKNSSRYGISASTPSLKANKHFYNDIFGRDASICSIGMVASKNKKLIKIAKTSLITLSKYQTKFGQIPFSVNPGKKNVKFYYLGSIDSTLWWLIALYFYNRYSGDKKLFKKLKNKINLALNWLFCQDHNNCGLLEQGEASDWADLMPSNGMVLYTNILWHKVLKLYKFREKEKLAYDGLNNLFLPFEADIKKSIYLKQERERKLFALNNLKKGTRPKPYYLNYVSHQYGGDRLDVYGNILAIIFNVANEKRAEKIQTYIIKNKLNKPAPIIVYKPPITKKDKDWRPYLLHHNLNKPNQYHNGGVWPYIGSFWVISLKKTKQINLAKTEIKNLAQTNFLNNWEFNEWLHGKTKRPMGMKGQSWNAATYILAYQFLKNKIQL